MKQIKSRPRNRAIRERQKQFERMARSIMKTRRAELEAAVDFSPLHGAPLWLVRIIQPEIERFLGKPSSRWRRDELRRFQETINTLPSRVRLAARTDPVRV